MSDFFLYPGDYIKKKSEFNLDKIGINCKIRFTNIKAAVSTLSTRSENSTQVGTK